MPRKKPTRPTPKKGTAVRDWKPAFLKALSDTANVRSSCQAAGIDRSTAYDHRASDPEFKAAWETALEDACDVLEAIARKRAADVSDTLLIFLLKAHRPEKYRENIRVETVDKVQLEIVEEIIAVNENHEASPQIGQAASDAGRILSQ